MLQDHDQDKDRRGSRVRAVNTADPSPDSPKAQPPMPLEHDRSLTLADADRSTQGPEREILRAEVNLLTFPFFALAKKGLDRKTEIEYKAVVERGDRKVEILWQVTANAKYGFPGPFDKRVHKAIEHLLTELEPPIQNPVPFSIYDLCRRMGINRSGRNYAKVKKALERIKMTGIKSRQAYYSKPRKRWIDDVFNLYERIIFKGEELPDGRIAETNYLYLSSWFLENWNALYLKPIDYDYYKELGVIAQRLYELLGVKFYYILRRGYTHLHLHLRYRYSTLCKLLPLTRQPYLSLAHQQLDPAHEELLNTGFLAKVEWEEKPLGSESDWFIYYYPGPRVKAEMESYLGVLPKGPQPEEAFEEREVDLIVEDILAVTSDEHSRPFYTQLAKLAVANQKMQDLIYRCLSEVKYEAHEGKVKKSKGALFTDLLKRYCKERGIDLGLRSD